MHLINISFPFVKLLETHVIVNRRYIHFERPFSNTSDLNTERE